LQNIVAAAHFPAVNKKLGCINGRLLVVGAQLALPAGVGSARKTVLPAKVVPVVDVEGECEHVEFIFGYFDQAR